MSINRLYADFVGAHFKSVGNSVVLNLKAHLNLDLLMSQ